MIKIIYFRKVFLCLLTISLFIPQSSYALTNGILATDLLGQYDQTSFTSPVPVYTKSGANDGPNRFGFNTPTDLALDSTNHRLFVSDRSNNRVLVYNLNTDNTFPDRIPDNVLGQTNFYANATATTQSGMNNPRGLVYDSTNNRLFVGDRTNHRVLVFDVASITDGENAINVLGQTLFTTATTATTAPAMNFPTGLAYDSVGKRLFVADTTNNRVTVYNVDPAVLIPSTPATDGANAVSVLGQALFTTATAANTQAGMNVPVGVTFDATNNRLFVSESTGNRVKVWDVASITDGENAINVLGQTLFTTATAATTQAGINVPWGVVYESNTNKLFVSQTTGNRVTVYNVDPAVLIANTPATDGANAVSVLGQTLFTTATAATTQAGLSSPVGMTYDSTNSRLLVAATGNNRVSIFDVTAITDGEAAVDLLGQYDQTSFTDPVSVYTKSGANDSPNRFGLALGTEVDNALDSVNHRLFVSDPSNNRVIVYNLNSSNVLVDKIADYVLGQPNFYTNTAATTQAGLSYPVGLAYNSADQHLFVADLGNNRVVSYDVSSIDNGENALNVLGQTDFTTSATAATSLKVSLPYGVEFDDTNERLFVSSQGHNRVLVYDIASITNGEAAVNVLGQVDFTSSGGARTQSRINGPQHIAFNDADNWLFVTDSNNGRSMIFDVTAITDGENAVNVLGQTDFTTGTNLVTQTGLNDNRGVAWDSANERLFIMDSTAYRLLIYDLSDGITDGEAATNVIGQSDFTSSANGATQSNFVFATGITYDSTNDKIIVGDGAGGRVLFFSLSTTPTSITAPSGFYNYGTSIPIYITFSNTVTVTGTPTLSLATGETIRTASYTSGSGTNILTFTYVTQPGDFSNDLDYTSTSALSLNGGTIIDSTNNNVATLTLPAPGASGSLSLTSNVSVVPPAAVSLGGGGGGWTAPWLVTTPPVVTIPTPTTPISTTCNTGDSFSTTTGLPCTVFTPTQGNTNNTVNMCPATQILTQNLKAGARNGQYHSYTKGIVKEVKILQAHMNRLGFVSGKEDGILGPITDGAIKRMQKQLGTTQDGLVGPITRGLINGSCGGGL